MKVTLRTRRGSGAPPYPIGLERTHSRVSAPENTEDPASDEYQAERIAYERYSEARLTLRIRLEAGRIIASILDGWSGRIHVAPQSLWRQHNADRILTKGEAKIPGSPNSGKLLVRAFAGPEIVAGPFPRAKISEAVSFLKEKNLTESPTRYVQKDLLRQHFPNHTITEPQFREIFKGVPTKPGRPAKPDAKP